jgi:hypothetical protein
LNVFLTLKMTKSASAAYWHVVVAISVEPELQAGAVLPFSVRGGVQQVVHHLVVDLQVSQRHQELLQAGQEVPGFRGLLISLTGFLQLT